MKTLVVIFFGLMVHVNQPFSLDNTVVIPYVEYHRPKLRIPDTAVVNFGDYAWVTGFPNVDHFYVVPLTNLKFRIGNTRGLFSDVRQNFVDAAPPLHTLVPGCQLRDEVRARKFVPSDLVSFVDYRGGRITPESYFTDHKVSFPSTTTEWKYPRCVVCTTRYEAVLSSDNADLFFEDDQGKKYVVRIAGNSALEVTNLPDQSTNTNHFDRHYSIFKPGCTPAPVKLDGQCTNTPGCPPPPTPFPDSDCTNSHYP